MRWLWPWIAASACVVLASCASAETARQGAGDESSSIVRLPASVDPADDCYVGSVDYSYPSKPPTVAYALGREPGNVSIAVMDIGKPEASRYGSADGARFRRDDPNWVFDIYTPWATTVVTQLAGKAPQKVYADGGSIGCDKLSGTQTWSLAPGTRAFVVSTPPLETPVPAGWHSIIWTWQVEGDRVLIPQPPDTIGREFEALPESGIVENGKMQDGSSISLTSLEDYLATQWRPRSD